MLITKSPKKVGKRFTVDMEVQNTHTYQLKNGCVSHNTSALLLGTSSGIHPHHAKRYFRRVQANKVENPLQFFKMFNPSAVEESVWSINKTDDVVTFLCEVPEGSRLKNSHSAIELLEDVKTVQQNWVLPGMRPERSKIKGISHNVSNTINVKDNEWGDVEEYIYQNRNLFAGISILPMSGDMDYAQAPMQSVYTSKGIVKEYGEGSLFASGLIVDGLKVFDNNLWRACDAVRDFIKPVDDEQKDWVRRAKKFAQNYFNNDVRKMVYCLKEVHSWKQWQDMKRDYTDVPWDQLIEDNYVSKNALDESATACAGGKCDVI